MFLSLVCLVNCSFILQAYMYMNYFILNSLTSVKSITLSEHKVIYLFYIAFLIKRKELKHLDWTSHCHLFQAFQEKGHNIGKGHL